VCLHGDTAALIACELLYCVGVPAVLCCCAVRVGLHQVNLLTQHGVTWKNGEVAKITKQNLYITGCLHGYETWSVAFREMHRFRAGC
jgi:hypothetical protein